MVKTMISKARKSTGLLVNQVQKGEVATASSGCSEILPAENKSVDAATKKRLGALETPGFVLSPAFFQPLNEEELELWDGGNE